MCRGHIVRDRLGLDPRAYHAALVRIQPYLPLNVRYGRWGGGSSKAILFSY